MNGRLQQREILALGELRTNDGFPQNGRTQMFVPVLCKLSWM